MKGLGKKNMEIILRELKDIYRSSTMENADFPEEIKETTKLFRESWITCPLKDIIDFFELVISEKYSGVYIDWMGYKIWKPNPKKE